MTYTIAGITVTELDDYSEFIDAVVQTESQAERITRLFGYLDILLGA